MSELNKVTINCPNCKAPILADPPKLELVNSASVSMIVWAKGEPQICKFCLKRFVGVIAQFDPRGMGMTYVPMPEQPEQKPILVS